MKSGIYYIFCNNNKKGYVGSSSNVFSRWINHKSNLKNKKHPNKIIQNSYNKYGENSFEYKILAQCPKEYLAKLEQWFKDRSGLNSTFNIRQECVSNKGLKLTEATKQKLREKAIGRKFKSEVIKKLSLLKLKKIKEDQCYKQKLMSNIVSNPVGERNPNSKITYAMVIEIRHRLKNGEKVCKMKSDYPCSQNMLYQIKNNRNWNNV